MGISIRVVLIAMMVVLAVISCTIIGVLIGQAGIESANQGADLLRQETVSRKQLEIGAYFVGPSNAVRSLNAASKLPGTFDINQWDTFHKWLCAMTRLNEGRITYIGTEIGYHSTGQLKDDGVTCLVEQYDAPSKLTPPNGTFRIMEYSYSAQGTPYLTQHWSVVGTTPSSFDPRVRPWYNVSRNTMTWSPVYLSIGPTVAAIAPAAPCVDPNLGRNVGVFASDFTTESLLDYLGKSVVAKTGQMILVDTANRFVLGASWNESAVLEETRTDCGNFKNETCQVPYMATLNDFTRPIMESTVSALGLDYLYECNDETDPTKPAACKTVFGKGRDRVLVDIASIEDEYGLDLRLIVMIPERDFLDEVWHRSDLAAIIASVVVASLIVVCVTIVYFVLKPLKRVEERLYAAATLNNTVEEDESQSLFTEVANIQEAYSKMAANLQRIRSYVPQSLLRTLDGDDDEDEEETEDHHTPHGSVVKTNRSRSSRGSRSSRRGSGVDAPTESSATSAESVVATGALLTTLGLNNRRATVLAMNLSDFHKDAHKRSAAKLIESHGEILTTIQTIVTANKGVLDSFSGDRFTITFNAVTNVASHVTRAAACIVQIGAKVPTANFGAATGLVQCGNMGSNEVKRFSMVSPVMNHAYALERLCRIVGVKSLVTYPCYETMQYEYHLEAVDVVQLPFTSAPSPLLRVLGAKQGGDEEWMYSLKNGEADGKQYTTLNEAFFQYARGETTEAAATAKTLDESLLGTTMLNKMVHTPALEWTKRLGLFYDVALHGSNEVDDKKE